MFKLDDRNKQLLSTIRLIGEIGKGHATAGELSRWTGIPKTTVKRRMSELTTAGVVLGDWKNGKKPSLQYSASYVLLTNEELISAIGGRK